MIRKGIGMHMRSLIWKFSGIAVLLFVTVLRGDAQLPESRMYETVKVGEGIYALIQPESNSQLVSGNSVVVIGDGGVLVVDTGNFPTLAKRMVAQVRQLTEKPVRYIVHTHWHPDHVDGDGEFVDAFPGLTLISTGFTRQEIIEQTPKYVRGLAERGPAYLEKLQKSLQEGKGTSGEPLTEEERASTIELIDDMKVAIPEYRQAKSVIPNLTFEQNLTLFLGKREVRVMFLGRGNTAGDAVVYLPDSKVVVTGDLVVYPTPYSFGSYPGEWIETLQKLMKIDANAIVPGHGPVMHDWEYAKMVASLIESVRRQAQAAVKQGFSLEETRKHVDLEGFRKRFAGENPGRSRAFHSGFEVPAVERCYQEAKGAYAPE